MMNRFFTLLLAASCLTAVGQVTYPYNPDGNADGSIAVGDLQDFLTVYGNPFSPSEIMVGDSSLTYWVMQLSNAFALQQAQIDSLEFLSSAGNYETINFTEGQINFIGNSSRRVVLELDSTDYLWYRLTGHNLQSQWQQVDSVLLYDLGTVAQSFGGIYKLEPMPRLAHRLSLDSCALSDVRIEFNQSFAPEFIIAEIQAQLQDWMTNNYFDEVEITNSPYARVYYDGAVLGDLIAPYRVVRFNPMEGWTVESVLAPRDHDHTMSHYWRLLDGSWSPF